MHCRAVLELVTMEEKQDFDLETEKFSRLSRFVFITYIFSIRFWNTLKILLNLLSGFRRIRKR